MKLVHYLFWVVGIVIGLLLGATSASAAQPPSASAASEESVSSWEFAQSYSNTLCYGNVSVRTFDIDGAIRAGLVEEAPVGAEGSFTPARPQVSWGECEVGGTPTSQTRLTNASLVVYMTLCDDMSSIGGMRVTYGIVGGVQEANVVYLAYGVEYDPCSSGGLYITEGNDWQTACLVQPLDVVYDPTGRSSIGMGTAPVQFHCDPTLG